MKRFIIIIVFLFGSVSLYPADMFIGTRMGFSVPGAGLSSLQSGPNFAYSFGVYTDKTFACNFSWELSAFKSESKDYYYPVSSFSFNFIMRSLKKKIDPYGGFFMGLALLNRNLNQLHLSLQDYYDYGDSELWRKSFQAGLIAGVDFNVSANVKLFVEARLSRFDLNNSGTYWTVNSGVRCFLSNYKIDFDF